VKRHFINGLYLTGLDTDFFPEIQGDHAALKIDTGQCTPMSNGQQTFGKLLNLIQPNWQLKMP
jgi:hypothetical protein